jgi:glutamate racemase
LLADHQGRKCIDPMAEQTPKHLKASSRQAGEARIGGKPKKLVIIHTTPATIEPLKELVAQVLPGFELVNFLDDSILPQLASNGGNTAEIAPRWIQFARIAEQIGADAVLSACSSIGEIAEAARQQVGIPVFRIDEPMAEQAVQQGERIGVAATLATTLNPTCRLLQAKAEAAGKQVTLLPHLVESAYQCLISGDKEGHDRILVQSLHDLASKADVIVLAQASMARVIASLPQGEQEKFLSSPLLGIERVKWVLEGAQQ